MSQWIVTDECTVVGCEADKTSLIRPSDRNAEAPAFLPHLGPSVTNRFPKLMANQLQEMTASVIGSSREDFFSGLRPVSGRDSDLNARNQALWLGVG